ncbi:MAG: hypothetical protein GX682_01130 [Clostridiaceae bacterium]|nr:hypothetical protein [Clostridiaceae bacterium]
MREYIGISKFAKRNNNERHGFPITRNRSYATGHNSTTASSSQSGNESFLTNYELREGFKKAFSS